jgi:hypothetical protein
MLVIPSEARNLAFLLLCTDPNNFLRGPAIYVLFEARAYFTHPMFAAAQPKIAHNGL